MRPTTSIHPPHTSGFIAVSKNFTKTALLLINDIISHKLAGIFAKPLSERDAPGYKDFVLRPQDLKSIKAAVSKGGRAVHAAIEAIEATEEEVQNDEKLTTEESRPETKEGSLGNGMFLVKRSEDLIPPKGIVNSSQLEMEVVRMFANAVMFNPLASSERGFGRSLRLRKNGGTIEPSRETDNGDNEEAALNDDRASVEASTPSEDSDAFPVDSEGEGGIIADTREMFEDIIDRVAKWKEVETERLAGTDDNLQHSTSKGANTSNGHDKGTASVSASVRHSSVSSALPEDEVIVPVDSGTHNSGTSRKRRRIAE